MILAALIVGLVAAWSYGLRTGGLAAATTFGLFLLAAMFPALDLYVYATVGVGVAALSATAARRPRHPMVGRALTVLRRLRQK